MWKSGELESHCDWNRDSTAFICIPISARKFHMLFKPRHDIATPYTTTHRQVRQARSCIGNHALVVSMQFEIIKWFGTKNLVHKTEKKVSLTRNCYSKQEKKKKKKKQKMKRRSYTTELHNTYGNSVEILYFHIK